MGAADGDVVGDREGATVGFGVGLDVAGLDVGKGDGAGDGDGVGAGDGEGVGDDVTGLVDGE